MRIEDRIIFNEIKKGNKEVYRSLFDEYYEKLVAFAKSYLFDQYESEDLVQDLFVYMWEHATKVNITTSIKAYFYQSIRNRCINHLKALKVKDKNHLLYMDGVLQADDDLQHFDPKILTDIMLSIDELPEQMGKVFRMKTVDGLSRDQIAEKLDISVNTVKTQLQRARQKLKEKLLHRTGLLFLL
ncbi:RNA polymerase sigma-70 factor [Carboxylicivirga mesophila]|uniref:RNA polymerase sigma-70 factor n=1 Tax=Carboxylicivirga mesophila TaxID=1166478 RepID=A0ABS5KF95_9BACT|nr:RNA polymerase sigma-70 factor [Carboxylicivirga mesophila]MBS2213567.1 RNA polymerase sigma-70 factor [Carboxylicivirga mesophila]